MDILMSSWPHFNVLLSIDVLTVVDRTRNRIVYIEKLVDNTRIVDSQTINYSHILNFRIRTSENNIHSSLLSRSIVSNPWKT